MGKKVLIIYGGLGHTCGPGEALWYGEPYIKYIVSKLIEKNVNHVLLTCENAVKSRVWNVQSSEKFDVVIVNGHGKEDVLTGYALDPIYFVDMTNQGFKREWVENSTFLTISCLTGVKLGPYMVNTLNVLNYLGFTKEFVMYVHYGRRWFSNDWRFSLDVIFLKPLAEAFVKYVLNEFTIDEVVEYIKKRWEEYLRDPLIPEQIKDAIKWNLNALTLIKRSGVEKLEEKKEEVDVRVTIFDNYNELEIFHRSVKVGEVVDVEVDVPDGLREGLGKVRFYVNNKLVHEVNVVLVKKRRVYKVEVSEPVENQEVEIGGKLRLVFTVKVIEEGGGEGENKFIDVVAQFIIKNCKVREVRRIGFAIDEECPSDLTRGENCCKYVVGIVRPDVREYVYGGRLFLKPGVHMFNIYVDLLEGEEVELTFKLVTPYGVVTRSKLLRHGDSELTVSVKIEDGVKVLE